MKYSLRASLGLLSFCGLALAPSCGGPARSPGSLDMSVEPPVAAQREQVETRHGREVADPYRWLRDDDRKDPDVLAYLEAENAYTAGVMKPTEALQQALYDEMLGRIKETDMSVPVRKGDWLYYSRTEEGKQYRIHCRKRAGEGAVEQIILDENRLAEGREYLRVGVLRVSPDHRLLAFSTNHDGSERFTLRFKDLTSGAMLPDEIEGTYYSMEWGNDNRTVFYDALDEAHRPYRLYRRVLGAAAPPAELVYEESDEAYFLGLRKTKDERYLILHLESAVTTEEHFIDADRPASAPRVIEPRRHKIEYSAEHWRDRFFILTNEDAIDFKLVEAPVSEPRRARWKTVVAHREGIKLDDIEVFRDHLALLLREGGLRGLRVFDLPSWTEHSVEFPEPVHTVSTTGNVEFDSAVLRFEYESMITPESVFDYDMRTRERTLLKQQEVLGGYDPGQYAMERLDAPTSDGKRVPIALAYRKELQRDGKRPLLLYGYGSYGYTIDPTFSSARVSLLDRGFVFAVANVRGGGALGRAWYEDGKLLRKRNTFTDFIAAAEHLVAQRYTSSDRLAIQGGSAGGLLVGAVLNLRPELFRVALAQVPFVDVVNTMLDPTIPLTVTEWEEWGNPQDPEFYEYMLSYSPYDNVAPRDYPDLLVTAGLNDPRVGYWEPAKWVARLRATRTGDGALLLKTNMGAGHSGASGRYEALKELAFEYAFVITRIEAALREAS